MPHTGIIARKTPRRPRWSITKYTTIAPSNITAGIGIAARISYEELELNPISAIILGPKNIAMLIPIIC